MLITTPAESTTTRRTWPQIIAASTSLGGTGVPGDRFAAPLPRVGGHGESSVPVRRRSRVGTSMTKLTSGTADVASGVDGGGAFEDRVQRIEAPLRIRAGHQRVAGGVAVAGDGGVPVGAELGVAEAFEDLDHHRPLRQPAAGMQMDLVADLGDPRPTTLMRRLGGAVGAVHVGEHLPPAHGDAELVMRQLGGVVDHHRRHIDQL